jgi:hypothetical protein
MAQRLYTLEEICEAGRQHCRAMGWRPTPLQAARIAALLRPHLDAPDQTVQTVQTAS